MILVAAKVFLMIVYLGLAIDGTWVFVAHAWIEDRTAAVVLWSVVGLAELAAVVFVVLWPMAVTLR